MIPLWLVKRLEQAVSIEEFTRIGAEIARLHVKNCMKRGYRKSHIIRSLQIA